MNIINQDYNGYPTTILDVSSEVTQEDGSNNGIWFFGDRVNYDDEIIIGMSPTNYHMFIICGQYEVHPRFAFNKIKLRGSRRGSIRAGSFIRIRNLPQGLIKSFQQYLQDSVGKRTPSCIEGIRQLLFHGARITIPQYDNENIWLNHFLEMYFKSGMIQSDLGVLKTEFYTTRNKSVEQMSREILKVEREFQRVGKFSHFLYKGMKISHVFNRHPGMDEFREDLQRVSANLVTAN